MFLYYVLNFKSLQKNFFLFCSLVFFYPVKKLEALSLEFLAHLWAIVMDMVSVVIVVVVVMVVVKHFLSVASSQTWINGSHSYWAQSWPMIGPWCTSSKILVRSKMATIQPILDFVRMDLSMVRSQYLIMWPGHGHAWTLSIVAHWCT